MQDTAQPRNPTRHYRPAPPGRAGKGGDSEVNSQFETTEIYPSIMHYSVRTPIHRSHHINCQHPLPQVP